MVALVSLTVGLVEVVKGAGLPHRFAPVAAIFIGLALSCFVATSVPMILLGGIAVGLMASGLYSGTRAMVAG